MIMQKQKETLQALPSRQLKIAGVTVLELLIVVAIIAIIASFAYPSYMGQVVRTKRTAATATLLQIANRQQQFFMDRKSYTSDLTDLGYGSDPFVISEDGTTSLATDLRSVYSISLSNVAATRYTITAVPLHGQLSQDIECGSLTLDQAGARGSAGVDCWN
jgi:type IV pilus assembly protein PilE